MVTFDSTSTQNMSGNRDTIDVNVDRMENVTGMGINWTNIPFTWYVIDATNNLFYLRVNALDTVPSMQTTTFDILLRPGTYNPDTLAQEFKRAVKVASANNGATPVPSVASWDMFLMPETTRLCIYTSDTNNASGNKVTFEVNFPDAKLAEILGFESGIWIATTARWNSTTSTLVNVESVWNKGTVTTNCAAVYGSKMCKLLGPTTIEVVSQSLSSLADFGPLSRDASAPADEVVLRVPVTSNYTNYMFFQAMSETVEFPTPKVIDNVKLYLRLYGKYNYTNFLASDGIGKESVSNHLTKQSVSYLPLNGEGWQICLNFVIDDGTN